MTRQASGGLPVRRLGTDLVFGVGAEASEDAQPLVPPDYVVSPGDELQVLLWGSVDADLRLMVDRSGRISVPRVGAIMVAGVRYADLQELIGKRVGQVFRNYQLSVSLGQLRNVRVFVTGYVKRPGAYSVSALSTLLAAVVRAGGPAAAGSFRDIQLRRAGAPVASIDLYDLMLRGDKSTDRMVQADDIIYVGPVGAQVGLIGSVNKAAVYEIKPGEKLGDVIAMAGGLSAIADRSRLSIERLDDRQANRVTELAWPQDAALSPQNGDVLRAYSAVEAVLPLSQQNKRIRIEGEVPRPGDYVVPAHTSTAAILRLAGGLTANAYLYGTEFTRESVRQTQQINYDRAVRDLETSLARATGSQRALDAGEAAAQAQQLVGNQRLIEKLKEIKPTGRIVFQIAPDATELPDLPLENGDRIYIPPKASTVGVFGSVFSVGSYLSTAGNNVGDFIGLAGGPTRGADASSTFVIRSNGSVISQPQKAGFLGFGPGLNEVAALAGDTIFVPEEANKTTLIQGLKEWSTVFFNFGLGAAALKTLR
ncbi:MAG: SLBB domain-containing protein [Leptothrix sp. (in: b-proteobacteria)]